MDFCVILSFVPFRPRSHAYLSNLLFSNVVQSLISTNPGLTLNKAKELLNLDPVVQSPISINPGLTLNKTYRVKPGPGCSKPISINPGLTPNKTFSVNQGLFPRGSSNTNRDGLPVVKVDE